MKKYIEKIKKYNIDVIILIILMTSLLSFLTYLNSWDELWNFANCYKIFNGYKIYKELNVIITPLFFYIAQIFFKLFGATMFTFKIYNIAIYFTFFMLIYHIFRELKIVRRRSFFYILLLFFIFKRMVYGGANYNILVLIPILINILLILKEKENNIITGILLFTTFMIKQNVFVFFAIGILVYKFLTRQTFKMFVISLTKIYSITIIGMGLFLLYMYLDNNLYYFIDYCFLGIKEFGANNTFFNIIESRYTWISFCITIFILIIINNKKTNKNIEQNVTKNSKMLLCFAIPLLIIQYPIANYYHSVLANLLIIISFLYIIEKILIQELEINRKKEKIFYCILVIAYFLYFLYFVIIDIIEINGTIVLNTQGPYSGTIAQKSDIEDIKIISEYIAEQENDGKNVIILSYKANLYNVNLNRNNGDFDLYFMGNLGSKGEQGLINKIKELKNTIILTEKNEENFIGQEAINARKYVLDNYKNIGEIQEYNIYLIDGI